MRKATNTFERGTVALGLKSASAAVVEPADADSEQFFDYHRIEVVSEVDPSVSVGEVILPRDQTIPPNSIELTELAPSAGDLAQHRAAPL